MHKEYRIMTVKEAVEKHENLISRIKTVIVPLQKRKVWNDDRFFYEVEDLMTSGNLCEERISNIVADALFCLKMSQPEVEHVKKLVKAFPEALDYSNFAGHLPIEYLTIYSRDESGKHGSKYISTLALEGIKYYGANMRGGLLCESFGLNMIQRLSMFCTVHNHYFVALKDLRYLELLMRKDIVDYSLLFFSCIGMGSRLPFQYLIKWHPEALVKTTFRGVPLVHAIMKYKHREGTQSRRESFKRFLKYSLPYFRHLLFLKDNENRTALKQAFDRFGETETMAILREVIEEEAAYPILHLVIIHQPKYYNLFLQWFPNMYHLHDENGRTATQVMLSMNRDFLQENTTCWVNQSTDQLEEKDPRTLLRPFASVAHGMSGDLDLSYQILRKHPSVIDVIMEQRDNVADASNERKRNAEENLEHDKKKKK